MVIEKQPILSKILSKLNNSLVGAQAYLLVGDDEDNLEKYSLIFSKILICPEKYTDNCSKCNICSRIKSGNFGELNIIKPVNNVIKKEEILSLKEKFKTKSIEGKNQVYIINNVDTLNSSAANSLLKFLEEPDDTNTIAIFTTTNINSVISTIVSRCQVVRLNNEQLKKGVKYIKKITFLTEEEIMDNIVMLTNIKN